MRIGTAGALACVALAAVQSAGCGGKHHHAGPPARPERVLYRDGPSGRYLLASGWTARSDPRDVGLRRGWRRPSAVAGFRPIAVPDAFNAGSLTRHAFRSHVEWYRVRFVVPRVAGTTGWKLRFEAVSGRADVFYRGRRVGSNDLPFLPFEVPLPGARPGVNEAVVRVDGRRAATPLLPASRPAGWWNYGGIVREVYLRRIGAFDVSDLEVKAEPGSPARVRLSARARNTTRRVTRLGYRIAVRGPGGFARRVRGAGPRVEPGGDAPLRSSFAIPHARLWGPAHPWLYDLRLRVPGGQVTEQAFGIRRYSVRGGRLLLNGRPLALRGMSYHELAARHGSALSSQDRQALLGELRALGANAAREHYPPHPALLEAFDRLGIVFWEQIPVWRLDGKELEPHALRPAALTALRGALLRDRNHPSLAVFSLSDETLRGGSAEAGYLAAAKRIVRRLAPGTLVSADTGLTPLARIPASYRALDAIGVNSYVGWYGSAPPAALGADLDVLRSRFPRQALVVTELGAEANRAGPRREKGTYAFQRSFLDRQLSVIDSKRYLSGALVWLLRDFPLRPGWAGGNPHPSPPINAKGLVREDGSRKPAFAVVRRHFRSVLPGSP